MVAIALFPRLGVGQDWASKMFEVADHDFGTVARGSKAEFRFALRNPYQQEVHIADVRSSCGCTTPSISTALLKPGEEAFVLARYNTRSFLGQKGATITVVLDRPTYAEVQLTVTGYIRSDVVFDPGEVNLGQIDEGQSAEAAVEVNYAGRQDWQIVDVRSANSDFEVELNETQRSRGRVGYRMLVRLLPTAPAGYIQDQLTIVTNDASMHSIPLTVQGRVTSPLSVSPASLFLGVLEPGQSVTKQLVVRGREPFRVTDIKCDGDCFEFKAPSSEPRKLHFIAVTFTAGADGGEISEEIRIETDLRRGAVAQCTASAQVLERQVAE